MPADKLLKKQDPPHLPHQPLLRWLVLVLAMVFPSITAWIYFVALAEPSTPVSGSNEANPIVLFAYGLSKAVQFGFPVLWMWFFGRESFRMLRPSPTGLGIGVVFGLAVAAGILAVYFVLLRGSAVLEKTPLLVRDKVVQFGAASPLRYAGLAVFLSAVPRSTSRPTAGSTTDQVV